MRVDSCDQIEVAELLLCGSRRMGLRWRQLVSNANIAGADSDHGEKGETNMDLNGYCHRWCAVQVRPRHEMSVSAILRAKGYEEFVPTYRVRRQWSDRSKQVEMPLFVGYVFCRLNFEIRWTIVATPGVIRIVGTQKGIALIDDQEIEAIQLVVKSGLKVEPCTYARIGDRVRIAKGPLAGMQGVVTRFKNQQRFVVSVDLIQSSVSVEVDGCDMIPLSPGGTSYGCEQFPVSHSPAAHTTSMPLLAEGR
jgi:transcription antitermination factor NusG